MSGRTVLVVDDEPAVRRTLERAVSRLGYRALPAEDAKTAYALLQEQPVHAVLLDLHLQHVSGETVYTELVDRWPELEGHIAFMSGDVDAVSPALRAAPRLAKPFELSTLGALLETLTSPKADA